MSFRFLCSLWLYVHTHLTLLQFQDTKHFHFISLFQTGAVHTEFYHDSDLTLGSVINVWGRKLQLCDCDEFTKEYYRTKYGIGGLSPLECDRHHTSELFPLSAPRQ